MRWPVSYSCANRYPIEASLCGLCWMACIIFVLSIPGQEALKRYVLDACLSGGALPSHGRGYQLNLAVPTIQ